MSYYRRRAEEELAAAQATSSLSARKAHQDLAERYSELAKNDLDQASLIVDDSPTDTH